VNIFIYPTPSTKLNIAFHQQKTINIGKNKKLLEDALLSGGKFGCGFELNQIMAIYQNSFCSKIQK